MTEHPDRPGYSFDPGPPPEASRFLRNKGLRPSFSWLDVEPEEHSVAFAVAKVAELDLLEAMRAEVQKALDEGLPLATFQKNWRANPRLAEWWGRRVMEDPLTGEMVEVQLGSPRRLKTIYDANLRTARAAGQWERIERTKGAFPFLEYTLGASEQHRPHHADKEGLILPVDSPFWDEWMPPNGWGCKCKVRPVTRREAERRGISATPDIRDRKVVNKRTGDVQLVPVGIDPGWQRNPGKLRRQAAEGLLRDRLEAAPEAVVRAAVKDIATSWAAERVLKGTSPGAVPVAVLPDGLPEAAGVKARVVRMTSSYGDKFEAKKRRVTTGTLLILSEALRKGSVLIERRAGRTDIYVMSAGSEPWVFVLKVMVETAEIWVRTIYPLKPAKRKAIRAIPGIEVFRD
jgi:hypothetical protein